MYETRNKFLAVLRERPTRNNPADWLFDHPMIIKTAAHPLPNQTLAAMNHRVLVLPVIRQVHASMIYMQIGTYLNIQALMPCDAKRFIKCQGKRSRIHIHTAGALFMHFSVEEAGQFIN